MIPWAPALQSKQYLSLGKIQPCMLALSPFLFSRHEQVPDAIKSQYRFPPPLIAPAAIRDGELICSGVPEESQTHLLNSEHLATQAEQQEVSERIGIPSPDSPASPEPRGLPFLLLPYLLAPQT